MCVETDRQTDRQKNRKTETQKETDRETDREGEGERERERERKGGRERERERSKFSCDVIAAMLEGNTRHFSLPWEIRSISMQNYFIVSVLQHMAAVKTLYCRDQVDTRRSCVSTFL